jgi:uncharacterized alkaline shock family protein YloU
MATNTPTSATIAGSTTSTSLGKTVIADSVVAKVAGIAASTVPGVHALGGGAARALGAIRGAIGGDNHAQGISVEVGELQVAADVQIVAEYPTPLQVVADGVRSAVIEAIETLVGLEVTEVNVTINDVHIPSDDKDEDQTAEARVL